MLVALATVLAAAACKSGTPDATPTTTEPPSTTAGGPATVPPPTITEQGRALLDDPEAVMLPGDAKTLSPQNLAVTLAYIRAHQAWIRAGMAPVNPDHPDLAATTGGKILENVQGVLRKKLADGYAYQAPKVFETIPQRFQVNPDSAWVVYCFAEQVPIYDVRTGAVVDNKLLSYDEFAELKPMEGDWVVTALEQQGEDRTDQKCSK